jgi:hypothetical protein
MQNKKANQAIPYNSSLVKSLEVQHKVLTKKHESILELAEIQQYQELNQSLSEFSTLITDHFRDERELYMYLELIVSQSDGSYRGVRAEMKNIAVSIFSTLNLHINVPVAEHSIDKFKKDFSLLGKDLLGRMRHEEKHLFSDYSEHGAES